MKPSNKASLDAAGSLRDLANWKNFNFVVHFLAAASFVKESVLWLLERGDFLWGLDWSLGVIVLAAFVAVFGLVIAYILFRITLPGAVLFFIFLCGIVILRPILAVFRLDRVLANWVGVALAFLVGFVVVVGLGSLISRKTQESLLDMAKQAVTLLALIAVFGTAAWADWRIRPEMLASSVFWTYLVRGVGWIAIAGILFSLLRFVPARK